MFRILVAALAAVWLAVPAGAATFHLRSETTTCTNWMTWGEIDCYVTVDFSLAQSNKWQYLGQDAPEGRLNIYHTDGTLLKEARLVSWWEGIDPYGNPYCTAFCARAWQRPDGVLGGLTWTYAGSYDGEIFHGGGMGGVGFDGAADWSYYGSAGWAELNGVPLGPVPLPAGGLMLLAAIGLLGFRAARSTRP